MKHYATTAEKIWTLVVILSALSSSNSNSFFTQALASISPQQQQQQHHRSSIVTGANGYVGREVVQVLLEDKDIQQQIYCLVRPARVQTEAEYWASSCSRSSSSRVTVLPYDMLDGGASITKALEAAHTVCDDPSSSVEVCVYHVASVFGPSEDHVQTAKDNVKGTEDLVESIAKFPNCRLVITSSMAAVRASGQDPRNGEYYTFEDWNTLSKLGESWGASYQWSKAESEKRSWEIAKKHGIPMSSICPSFVFGPPSDGKLSGSFSITLVGQWVRGESPVQSRLCVDIRDVARAHVAAGTRPEAIGQRYIVSTEERVPSREMAEALQEVCQETGLGAADTISFDADFKGGAIPIGAREVEATERLQKNLGITLRPVHETVADMGRSLLQSAASKEPLKVEGSRK